MIVNDVEMDYQLYNETSIHKTGRESVYEGLKDLYSKTGSYCTPETDGYTDGERYVRPVSFFALIAIFSPLSRIKSLATLCILLLVKSTSVFVTPT